MASPLILAVEIGGSGARTAYVRDNRIFGLAPVPSNPLLPEGLVKCITGRAMEYDGPVDAIVVSISGFVADDGTVECSTNTHFPPFLPLRKMIMEKTACAKVLVLNDLFVAGTGSAAVFPDLRRGRYNCINFGGGVGQCACLDGKVIGPCEFGHSRVACGADTPLCACGKQGCAESFLGGEALKKAVLRIQPREKIPEGVHPCAYLDGCYRADEEWAVDIYERFTDAAAIYLANFQLAIPAPVYTLRGSVARKSLSIPEVMEAIKWKMLAELPAKSWMPEFRVVPPPEDGLPADYDAFLGAGLLGGQLVNGS